MIKRFILTLTVCLSTIIVFGQTKTPYEKRKEEIFYKYLKKLGVTQTEINRAKNADETGMLLFLLVGEKLLTLQYSDPMEYLFLSAEIDKEIKTAEKLKSAEDYRREEARVQKKQQEQTQKERERIMTDAKTDLRSGNYEEALNKFKKANSLESTEETTQLIHEVKLIQFISFFASKNRNKIVEMINYPYDMGVLPAIKNKAEMTQRFDEVFDDYLIKLIGNSTVSDWEEVGWRGIMLNNGEIWIDEFDNKLKIKKINYSTSVHLSQKNEMIERERNSLHESIRDFKNPVKVGETNTQRFRIDRVEKQLRLAIWNNKTTPWDEKPDVISENGVWQYDGGSEMIGAYIFNVGKFAYIIPDDEESIIIKDTDKIANVDWKNLMDNTLVAWDDYLNLVTCDATIKTISFKILSQEEVIAEITKVEQLKKQQEYIQIASQKFQEGELSQAKSWYEKALNIKHSDTIAKSLRLVKEEIKRVNELKELLKQRYTDVSNNHSLLENPQIINQLPTIKKGYDVTYRTCLENINQGLKGSWVQVASTYNENLPNFEKRETWANEDQNILDKINEFSQKVVSYNKFNDKILEFLANNDKKSLKIFKEKDPSVIVSFLMN